MGKAPSHPPSTIGRVRLRAPRRGNGEEPVDPLNVRRGPTLKLSARHYQLQRTLQWLQKVEAAGAGKVPWALTLQGSLPGSLQPSGPSGPGHPQPIIGEIERETRRLSVASAPCLFGAEEAAGPDGRTVVWRVASCLASYLASYLAVTFGKQGSFMEPFWPTSCLQRAIAVLNCCATDGHHPKVPAPAIPAHRPGQDQPYPDFFRLPWPDKEP
ncbi:hypothetical protein BGZ61DRAFT_512895 [Ilyonectria robusta]|uniref:uncharacterized protein n=1 Tax=Ilyonectria robusta TaxID=1079257 RepID=UPI001E8D3B7C|nr:uncharacterized protein BGZ61DRAFT_512895 [Ilyonectria robusta]KAH8735463.1 hypothetical protein BGZ61DRAFT_512895 [Ilyonectria robusta]